MPVFSKDDKAVLFIHVPKSAGSSIERIGSDLGWEESFSIRGKSLSQIGYFKATPQHLHASVLQEIFDFTYFDSVFTVVRNPYDRFKSEYYWQRSQGITALGVDDWISDIMERYSRNSYLYDNHIRPQVEFVPEYENINVFRLEDGGVEEAKNIFLKLSSSHSNGKPWKKRLVPRLNPIRQEKRSVRDPSVEEKFLDHYQTIVEFYKDDFSAFSYEV